MSQRFYTELSTYDFASGPQPVYVVRDRVNSHKVIRRFEKLFSLERARIAAENRCELLNQINDEMVKQPEGRFQFSIGRVDYNSGPNAIFGIVDTHTGRTTKVHEIMFSTEAAYRRAVRGAAKLNAHAKSPANHLSAA